MRPPPITQMGCGGHGGKSWHIPARRDSTGVGVMLAPCPAAPGLCRAKDKGCRVHPLIYCCGLPGAQGPCAGCYSHCPSFQLRTGRVFAMSLQMV